MYFYIRNKTTKYYMNYLLYDSECPFCCQIIKKISALIETKEVSYIKIKSKKGKELIKTYSLENIKSVIYIKENKKVFIKSDAILNLCREMKMPYKILYVLTIIPKFLSDLVYDFVAKNRMSIKI